MLAGEPAGEGKKRQNMYIPEYNGKKRKEGSGKSVVEYVEKRKEAIKEIEKVSSQSGTQLIGAVSELTGLGEEDYRKGKRFGNGCTRRRKLLSRRRKKLRILDVKRESLPPSRSRSPFVALILDCISTVSELVFSISKVTLKTSKSVLHLSIKRINEYSSDLLSFG